MASSRNAHASPSGGATEGHLVARVGVEIGGTFTDLVAFDGDHVAIVKVLTTPDALERGTFDALSAARLSVSRLADFAHGSTVATNAILERKGERVAFVTTAGFRDLLYLQRHDRRNIYNLHYRKPEPVAARGDCFEVDERILADGRVLVPLDDATVQGSLIPALEAGGFRAVAICLLNSYANPSHEERLARLLRARLPGLAVTCSIEVVREFREYERASTTTLSAYVQPVIAGYLARFSHWLSEREFVGRFTVMQSNGGRLPAEAMEKSAITALFSGPAAGVVGAARQAARSGFRNLITFDMGGTSTDVSLVENGEPRLSNETEVQGLPVRTPVLDIVSVGAGGGSIVWIDDGGMLRVGPRSAGAVPGPACYRKGGALPTITDAHVVCGSIHPQARLGGCIEVDAAVARQAFVPIAAALDLSVEQAAESAIRLANANIVRAIQLVSTERGRDPRDYVIVPFGGAGPLHATMIAADLGVERVVVPPNPGVMSAYGLLASDYVKHESLTLKLRLDDEAPARVRHGFDALRDSLLGQFADMGLAPPLEWSFGVDLRFVGQAFEVTVSLDTEAVTKLTRDDMERRFVDEHHRMFFHGEATNRAIEIICLRVAACQRLMEVPKLARDAGDTDEIAEAPLFADGRWGACRRLPAGRLAASEPVEGPMLLEGRTATILVSAGWRGNLDAHDNLIVTRSHA